MYYLGTHLLTIYRVPRQTRIFIHPFTTGNYNYPPYPPPAPNIAYDNYRAETIKLPSTYLRWLTHPAVVAPDFAAGGRVGVLGRDVAVLEEDLFSFIVSYGNCNSPYQVRR